MYAMRTIMRKLAKNHHGFWIRENLRSFYGGLGFFAIALVVQRFADNYVNKLPGTPVDDLFLSHLPPMDIDGSLIFGSLLITFLGLYLFFTKPKYLSFGVKSLAIFIITRSFLISLTHLGPSPHQLVFDSNSVGFSLYNVLYNTNNDFFFSGHTGIPFLLGLIFWPEKPWRYVFMTASVVFGVGVLVAHIHYSIDVFAAPFITYSIFAVPRHFFPRDYVVSR